MRTWSDMTSFLFTSSYLGFGGMCFGLGWIVLSILSNIPLGVTVGIGVIITMIGIAVTINALSKLEKIEVSEDNV